MFLKVQKNLSPGTVEKHITLANVFLEHSKGAIDAKSVQNFMLWIKNTKSQKTYANYLCTLKVLLRDYLKQPELIVDFKFPTIGFKPKILPSKQHLKTFFQALPSLKYQIIFLALASSGLRVSELLSANIDRTNRMLIPKTHNGTTKNAWVSFYDDETEKLLKAYQGNPFENSRNTVTHVFRETANKTSINITPQTLRSVFAREMSRVGVQDRYIDCFCGRTPQSVLARHYSDYSPEVLREIYIKANIKILV
jgi:integrase